MKLLMEMQTQLQWIEAKVLLKELLSLLSKQYS